MLLSLFLLPIVPGDAFNVLVYSPAFAASHTNFMARLADTLTEAGHNVTFLVPIVDEDRRDQLGVRITTDIVVVEKDEIAIRESVPFDDSMEGYWFEDPDSSNVAESFSWFFDGMAIGCENFLRNQFVLDQMKSRNFDVAIVEPLSVCGLAFAKKLGIEKTILASSCAYYDAMFRYIGESNEHSSLPSIMSVKSDQMSFWERFENHKVGEAMNRGLGGLFDSEQKAYRKLLGEDIPDWRELLPAASLYFTNANPYMDFPRSVIQKTVLIGGISVDIQGIKAQRLNEEWDGLLNRRKHNMLISFGSMIHSSQMPEASRKNLVEVIKSEPDVTFIWKYETNDTSFADGVPNIHFCKWVPQVALLNDKRLTAFLTHGGLGSTNELAHLGKPAVMVPIFADQYRNAHMLARHGGVLVVHKSSLSDWKLMKRSIRSILYDERFKKNADRLADLLQNQPTKPEDLVVKHTEFVAKYGPFPQMDPYGRQLNFFQLHLLDVYIVDILIQLFSFSLVFYIIPVQLAKLIRKQV